MPGTAKVLEDGTCSGFDITTFLSRQFEAIIAADFIIWGRFVEAPVDLGNPDVFNCCSASDADSLECDRGIESISFGTDGTRGASGDLEDMRVIDNGKGAC